jgi:hypothetical protein
MIYIATIRDRSLAYSANGRPLTRVSNKTPDKTGVARLPATQMSSAIPATKSCSFCCLMSAKMNWSSRGPLGMVSSVGAAVDDVPLQWRERGGQGKGLVLVA